MSGIEPEWCYYCFFYEKNKMSVKRKEYLKKYEHMIPTILENTDEDGNVDTDKIPLVEFDLRLSNLCNFNCILCNNKNSIRKSGKLIDWGNKELRYIRELLDNKHNINEIYFTGGEPFIIDSHWKILKELIKDGASKNINLRYTTNTSKMKPFMFDLWNEFKSVTMAFSIDAIGKEAERIRKGTDWNKIEKNLIFFDENTDERYNANLLATISIFNVLTFPTLIRWFLDMNFKRIHMIYTSICFSPFTYSILGREYLLDAIDKYYEDIRNSKIKWVKNIYNIIVNAIKER